LRAVSIERGIDPREVVMIAFGGSGPVHCAELAATLGIRTVYVPAFPGIFSALGLMLADFRYDSVRGKVRSLTTVDASTLAAEFGAIEDEARQELINQSRGRDGIELLRYVDVQYVGQDSPLTLPFPESSGDLHADIATRFKEAHRVAFGYSREDAMEIASLRVHGTAPAGSASITELAKAAVPVSVRGQPKSRQAIFADLKSADVPVLARMSLGASTCIGPLIVEEWDTSIVVPPGWNAHRDGLGNIVLNRSESHDT
jgi:N-methylhydantoinase A